MYFVIELQKAANDACSILTFHDDNWNYQQAESVWHGKCQSAAISVIPCHTVMLVDVEGAVYKTETYAH